MSQNAERKQSYQEESIKQTNTLHNRSKSKKKRNQQSNQNPQKIVDIHAFKEEKTQEQIEEPISEPNNTEQSKEQIKEPISEPNDTEITQEQIEESISESNDTEITQDQIEEASSESTALTKRNRKKKQKKEMIIIETSQTRMTKKKKQVPQKQKAKAEISKEVTKEVPQQQEKQEAKVEISKEVPQQQEKQEAKVEISKEVPQQQEKQEAKVETAKEVPQQQKKQEAKVETAKEVPQQQEKQEAKVETVKEVPQQQKKQEAKVETTKEASQPLPLNQVSFAVKDLKTTTKKADTAIDIFSKAEPEKVGLYTSEELKEREKAKRLEIREENKVARKERRELRKNPIIPEDETPKQERRRVRKEKRKRRRRRFVFNTVRNVAVMTISVYGGYYAFHAYNTYQSNQMYEEIARSVTVNGEAVLSIEALQVMKAQYDDYEGYIHIPDTNLSYPLMKTTKEKGFYYLTRDIENKATTLGTPFVDYRVNVRNIYNQVIIYGVIPDQGGEMFHVLTQYKDPEFMQAHNPIYIANDEHKLSFYEFVWAVDVAIDDPDAVGWLDSLQPHEADAREYFKALYEKADLISDAYMYQQTHQYMTLVGILPEDKGYTLVCFEKGYGL